MGWDSFWLTGSDGAYWGIATRTKTKIFQRATKIIRSEWRSTFTSSDLLRSTLVWLESENESTTVHVLVKNVTADQIDEVLSQLPCTRMTQVWVEVDDAIISITLGKTHELTGRTFILIFCLLL